MTGPRGEGAHHLPPVGVDAPAHPDGAPARDRGGQVGGLDARAGAVVEGGVGHGQAEETAHHGLVLEQRLQHPLGHLGLIGRVGGHELGAHGHPAHHRGYVVVVGARAGEAHQVPSHGPVAAGQTLHLGHHVGLGQTGGKVEAGQAQGLGDGGEQLVQRGEPEEAEHGVDVGIGVGDEVSHGRA